MHELVQALSKATSLGQLKAEWQSNYGNVPFVVGGDHEPNDFRWIRLCSQSSFVREDERKRLAAIANKMEASGLFHE